MAGSFIDSLIVVVLDSRAAYLGPGAEENSLLTTPLGGASLLDHLATELEIAGGRNHEILVTPCFSEGPAYEAAVQRSTRRSVRVVPLDQVGSVLCDRESTDNVLLVDPRYWPVGGYELASWQGRHGDYRGVTHAVAVGSDPEGMHEWVERDPDGRVKGVQRCYDHVTWPEVANSRICLTLLAGSVMGPPPLFSSLRELRSILASRGMLSRDVAVNHDVYDLNHADALLALSERVLTGAALESSCLHWASHKPGVWIGPDCRIHPSARLVPPVVLHAEVVVEAGSAIIGPTVVGSGSWIGPGAIVAQSLLAPRSIIPEGGRIRERVICASGPVGPGDASEVADMETEAAQSGNADSRNSAIRLASAQSRGETKHPGRRIYDWSSRALNLLLAGLGLVLLAPVGAIVALLIKLDSRGAVFFGHEREGKGGRAFRCWKFRTMVSDAHQLQRELYAQNDLDGPQFKLRHDPRITRMGRWLRSTNLDEVPQLFNVLLGHMNLVGPRPSPFRENQICVPWRRARLSVRPGITGLWQICRHGRSAGDFHQWIHFDLAYVRNLSLRLDMKILFATVLTLGGRWNVPAHWLIPAHAETSRGPGRRFMRGGSRSAAALAVSTGMILSHAALTGCHDPRISLSEFLTMQQEAESPEGSVTTAPSGEPLADRVLVPYRIGPSDVLTITMTGSDAGTAFPIIQARVDREGSIELPLVGRFKVQDLEIEDVEDAIRGAYVPAILKDLAVHAEVFYTESTQVLVVGAVTIPGLIKLRRTERNMLFALVAAGGVTELSSGRATLRRIRRPAEQVTLNLTDPVELEAALALAPLENGDIVTVIPAKPNTVFVGGLVNAPHPQPYPQGVELTVLQAIAASSGLRTDVTPREATLIRRMPDGQDVHVKIDLDRVTTARDPNITLAAGDILWVPDTIETRVQDWINRNVFIKAGATVNYNVTGVEYLNRASQQSGQFGGGSLQDSFDPFGFLGQNAALQNLTARPAVTTP